MVPSRAWLGQYACPYRPGVDGTILSYRINNCSMRMQVNVRELHVCNNPDQFATVRATAEFKARALAVVLCCLPCISTTHALLLAASACMRSRVVRVHPRGR